MVRQAVSLYELGFGQANTRPAIATRTAAQPPRRLTGSPPTKRATRRNCCRRCATARLHNCSIFWHT